ncbi:MAG: hypothetical protein ABJJ53_19620 [Sulfitobacter sp.]
MKTVKPAISFWCIAAMGLIWNLMGCMNFISQTNADALAQFPESYQAVIASRPAWATAAFAVAVFGGAVGCILLLMRRAVAVGVCALSLMGIALTLVHVVVGAGLSSQVLMPTLMSLLVGIVLFWVAYVARQKDWLR